MLSASNGKLGDVFNFSIPAGSTCPGKTGICDRLCYAQRGNYRRGNVQRAHNRNWRESLKPSFVSKMAYEIKAKGAKVVRIHSAGDFYDEKYIRKWTAIADLCPDTEFYTYTRSWRVPKLLWALRIFESRSNVHLWLSCDCDTDAYNGKPPIVGSSKIAYMQTATEEPVPQYSSLVFRAKRGETARFIDGVFVCPHENGTGAQVSCSTCRLCWSSNMPSRQTTTYGLEPAVNV